MAEFGDADPEDAWDPDDPPEILVDNLRRRLVLLLEHHDRARQRIELAVRDLGHVVTRIVGD
jgi:hypothetical protein